jgi:hypothetical protein
MSHPYVTSAEIKGNYIEIGVEADDYEPGTWIEISGHATQSGGAFANFYDIQPVPEPAPSRDGKDHRDVYVRAHPLPPNQFRETEDVSIVVRVGKVWLTVLGRDYEEGTPPDKLAENGTRWDQLRKWSEVNRSSDWPDGYPGSY